MSREVVVASNRQIEANRRNALKSTGPRSPGGKVRSARNSKKHGLASDFARDPVAAYSADRLAKAIVRSNNDLSMSAARKAALAAFGLQCVYKARVAAIEQALSNNDSTDQERLILELNRHLKRIDHYEAKFIGRKHRALGAILAERTQNS